MITLKTPHQTLHLRPTLFWDVELSRLDPKGSKRLIIERVFTRGNLDEFRQLIRFYSEDEIREEVVNIGYLDPKTLNFISKLYNIPQEDFLCYKKQQSNPVHWNS